MKSLTETHYRGLQVMRKSKKLFGITGHRSGALYLTFLIDLHTLETSLQKSLYLLLFVVMGVLAFFLKSKYAEESRFRSKPDRRGAARRAARRRGLELPFLPHVPSAGRLAHMYALGKAALYARRVVRCVLHFARSSRCCFSPAHGKTRLDGAAAEVLAFLLMGNFVFLFFTSDASS